MHQPQFNPWHDIWTPEHHQLSLLNIGPKTQNLRTNEYVPPKQNKTSTKSESKWKHLIFLRVSVKKRRGSNEDSFHCQPKKSIMHVILVGMSRQICKPLNIGACIMLKQMFIHYKSPQNHTDTFLILDLKFQHCIFLNK